MLTVCYDCQDGKYTLGLVEAAEQHFRYVLNIKGQDWIDRNSYTKDHALMDYLCGNYAWIESDGVKLCQEGSCESCKEPECPMDCTECCEGSITFDDAIQMLLNRIATNATFETGGEIANLCQAVNALECARVSYLNS